MRNNQFDPKLQVITCGYEGGYIDIDDVGPTKIALNVHKAWYYGPHEAADDYKVKDTPNKFTIVDAVFLG